MNTTLSTLQKLPEPYCANCGYVLTGVTESTRCPECGQPLVDVLVRRGQRLLGGIRYRSEATLLGLPLLSIAVGPTENERSGHAKGFIAIGDVATGGLAMGGWANGVVALGGGSVGLFSAGGMSIGLLTAVGGMAVGGIAAGGMAIGGIASGGGALGVIAKGGGAIGYFAAGGGAYGRHVIDGRGASDPTATLVFDSLAWLLGPSIMSIQALIVASIIVFGAGLLVLLTAWIASSGELFSMIRQAFRRELAAPGSGSDQLPRFGGDDRA